MDEVFEGVFKFLVRAFVFMLRAVAQLFAEALAELFFYWTARLLAPPLTLGRVSVEPFGGPSSRFNLTGIERRSDGGTLLKADAAAGLGAMFWLAVLIGVFLWNASASTAEAQPSFSMISSEIS